jgi:hypothetical protein
MKQLFSNNARSSLADILETHGVEFRVAAGTGDMFSSPQPGEYEMLTISNGSNYEIVKLLERTGDSFYVERAVEGVRRKWLADSSVSARLTAKTMEELANLARNPVLNGNTLLPTARESFYLELVPPQANEIIVDVVRNGPVQEFRISNSIQMRFVTDKLLADSSYKVTVYVRHQSEGCRVYLGNTVYWSRGVEPQQTLLIDGLDIYEFRTIDQGRTWYGTVIATDMLSWVM